MSFKLNDAACSFCKLLFSFIKMHFRFMFLHSVIAHYLLSLSSIEWMYNLLFPSIHLVKGILVASLFWQLVIRLLWWFMCKCLAISVQLSFWVLAHFLSDFFFVLSYRSFLHILEINSFSDRWFSNIFSCSVDDFFTPVAVSFATRNSLLCTHTCLFCLLLTALLVFYVQKDHCQNQCQRSFSLMCCSRSSTFSGLMWKSLIHFELTLVYGIRWGLISFHFFLLVCG